MEQKCCGLMTSKWTNGFILSLVACLIGGSLHRGFATTELNPIEPAVMKWLKYAFDIDNGTECQEMDSTEALYSSNYKVAGLWSAYIGIRLLGQIIACLTVAPVADQIGRKNTISLIVCGCSLLSLLQNVGVAITSYPLLIIGRIIDGFGDGVIAMLIPLHFNEISPTMDRGRIASCHALFLSLGWWLSPLLGLTSILGDSHRWSYIFVINAGLTIPLLILAGQPEGPKFLLLQKNDVRAATNAIHYYQGLDINYLVHRPLYEYDIQHFISVACHVSAIYFRLLIPMGTALQNIYIQGADVDANQYIQYYRSQRVAPSVNPLLRMIGLLRQRNLRLNLLLTVTFAFTLCFSGVGPVASYLTGIIYEAGAQQLDAKLCFFGIAVLRTVLSLSLVIFGDRVSRKRLLLTCLWTCSSAIVALVAFHAIDKYAADKTTESVHLFLVGLKVLSIFLWASVVAILNALCPLVNLECYPQGHRAAAGATLFLISYSMNYIVTSIFPLLQVKLGIYTVCILLPFLLPSALYLSIKMPETTCRETADVLRDINPDLAPNNYSFNERNPLISSSSKTATTSQTKTSETQGDDNESWSSSICDSIF